MNILIIGATSAIATACARRWATRRANFFLVGRNKDHLQQTCVDLIVRGALGPGTKSGLSCWRLGFI
jgi:decaprenylphospho-beta-D-erythro-pentofuranosid-2-ulose 2-reductase